MFSIPNDFTGDPDVDPGVTGIDRLFFGITAPQQGNGPGMPNATSVTDLGFDITSIVAINFDLGGSGGLDNFAAVPMPHPAALAGVGLMGVAGIRRRR